MGGSHERQEREHNLSVQHQHHAQPEHTNESGHHAPTADNRQAPQTGSQRMAMFQQHYAAHRAAQRAAEDGQHSAASAPSPDARQVAQDLARPTPDYVGAIQAMDKDPDAHERQRLAATITSQLDAHLSRLSMYDMLRTLHNLDTHGCLGQIKAALIHGAAGVTAERLAFAYEVLAFGIDALEGPRPHYLVDHADDYEGAVTYLQLSAHPTPTRSSQLVAQDLARGNVVGALQVMDKDLDRTESLYLLEMILHRLEAWLGQRSMYDMLRTLQPLKAQGYLDRRTELGDTFQTLLVNTAVGLNKDRLTFALSVLKDGPGALTPSDHEGYLPQYLVGPPATTKGGVTTNITHFDDLNGAVRYLEGTHRQWQGHKVERIFGSLPVASPELYEDYITEQVHNYQTGSRDGTRAAADAVAGDGFDYSAFWLSVAGAALGAAACLMPEVAPGVILADAVAGGVVQGVSSLPHNEASLRDAITSTLGAAGSKDEQTLCGHIEASKGPRIRAALESLPRDKNGRPLQGDYEVKLHLLKRFFQPEVIRLSDGGDPSVVQGAVEAVVKRSLLLGAVGLGSRNGSQGLGTVVYSYNATNIMHQGDDHGYNRPEAWTYTLAETALVVVSQLRQAVSDALAQQDIVGADLVGPKVVAINQHMYIPLDKTNAVVDPGPQRWVYDEARQRFVLEPDVTFKDAVRDTAWGNKERRPPRTAIQRVTDSSSS